MQFIYTDGAHSSTRNQGGWAFIVIENDKEIHNGYGSVKNTTNNRMEIMGALEAIKWSTSPEITIFTDSMYLIGTMTKNWKRNKNTDLWEQMEQAIKGKNIKWSHIKGHSGDKWNNRCDILAVHGSHINIVDYD